MLTVLVTSFVGTHFQNTLLNKERGKEKCREDDEGDASSYWMTLRKREDTGN
jgi:hypothetical protein